VAEVGGPVVLRVGHESGEVLLQALVVERLEGLGVVELLAEGVGDGSILAENVQAEFLWPPVTVGSTTATDGCLLDGAL